MAKNRATNKSFVKKALKFHLVRGDFGQGLDLAQFGRQSLFYFSAIFVKIANFFAILRFCKICFLGQKVSRFSQEKFSNFFGGGSLSFSDCPGCRLPPSRLIGDFGLLYPLFREVWEMDRLTSPFRARRSEMAKFGPFLGVENRSFWSTGVDFLKSAKSRHFLTKNGHFWPGRSSALVADFLARFWPKRAKNGPFWSFLKVEIWRFQKWPKNGHFGRAWLKFGLVLG